MKKLKLKDMEDALPDITAVCETIAEMEFRNPRAYHEFETLIISVFTDIRKIHAFYEGFLNQLRDEESATQFLCNWFDKSFNNAFYVKSKDVNELKVFKLTKSLMHLATKVATNPVEPHSPWWPDTSRRIKAVENILSELDKLINNNHRCAQCQRTAPYIAYVRCDIGTEDYPDIVWGTDCCDSAVEVYDFEENLWVEKPEPQGGEDE